MKTCLLYFMRYKLMLCVLAPLRDCFLAKTQRRKARKNIWLIALISIAFGTVSCSEKDKDEDKITFTVTFDAAGGKPVPEAQIVEEGATVTAPANPVKDGYVFLFWHLKGASDIYSFNTPVNSDITLVAKWKEDNGTIEYWKVSWVLNGGAWPSGSNPATQVVKGNSLVEPNAPAKEGSAFDGWYKETALTNKVVFPYAVTADVTLYAKWKTESGGTTAFTIRNTAEWTAAVNAIKAGGNNKSYTLVIEGTVPVPPTTGVEQGKPSTYTFGSGDRLSVTLTGSGTLALSAPGFLLCLSGYVSGETVKQKLIIDGPVLHGRADNTVPLLRMDYADLELKTGKITENTNNGGGGSGFGGGVYFNTGVFNMSGGEISNNICGQKSYVASGGGVCIRAGVFNMSGGTINGNIGNDGGGVFTYSTFNMTGGVIKGNTAMSSSPYGGGVYVHSYGSFSKTGGIIYGSNADDTDKNKAVNFIDNTSYGNRGAAVYHPVSIVINTSKDERRESTLGEKDNISTGDDNGWRL